MSDDDDDDDGNDSNDDDDDGTSIVRHLLRKRAHVAAVFAHLLRKPAGVAAVSVRPLLPASTEWPPLLQCEVASFGFGYGTAAPAAAPSCQTATALLEPSVACESDCALIADDGSNGSGWSPSG